MGPAVLRCLLLLGTAALLAPASAHAEAMRCGVSLVKNDSSLELVRDACGPPFASSHRIEHRTRGEADRQGHVTVYQWDVVIDQLRYDFGPHEFVYDLTFEDGRMVSMVRGSWGTAH
ncbi:MAG: hypothetical protein JWN48_5094 [Myxococcaceae bacterium]|nr:hypothetical protein [Myxococcaceae bacterium]